MQLFILILPFDPIKWNHANTYPKQGIRMQFHDAFASHQLKDVKNGRHAQNDRAISKAVRMKFMEKGLNPNHIY